MKKVILSVLIMSALIGAGWGARIGYKSWKQEHLLREARYYLSKDDATNAVLCLQQAVKSDPSDVEACRLFADLAEMSNSRNAVFWRRRVSELEPEAYQDRIQWANTALKFGDLPSANEALDKVSAAGKKTVEYYKSVGALAWSLNLHDQAETNYMEAVKLEPDNPITRLNFATVELVSSSEPKRAKAREMLEALSTNETVRCRALRELTIDAIHNGNVATALTWGSDLQRDPASGYADRMMYLDVLREAHSPQLPAYLASIQYECQTNYLKAYELGRWMCKQGQTNETIAWVRTLPLLVQTNMPMPLLSAEIYSSQANWTELEELVKKQDWKYMEHLRHVYYSKALRAQEKTAAASVEWRSALNESQKSLEALQEVVRTTLAWGWQPETDETLWAIVDQFPLERGASVLLYDRLFAAGNTQALYKLLAKIIAVAPPNAELKNNMAIVSMLLDPRETKAQDMAHDAYIEQPKNPLIVSTYAYSLYLQHRSDEALKLFESLDAQALATPGVATYYGVILAGAGKSSKAKAYLDVADGAKLLPEERNLIRKARAGIASS
jgi:tetratricopeptide (TPR) repeat protein